MKRAGLGRRVSTHFRRSEDPTLLGYFGKASGLGFGSPVETSLDREAHQLVAPVRAELGHDVLHVILDGLHADEELPGDLAVRVAREVQSEAVLVDEPAENRAPSDADASVS